MGDGFGVGYDCFLEVLVVVLLGFCVKRGL